MIASEKPMIESKKEPQCLTMYKTDGGYAFRSNAEHAWKKGEVFAVGEYHIYVRECRHCGCKKEVASHVAGKEKTETTYKSFKPIDMPMHESLMVEDDAVVSGW